MVVTGGKFLGSPVHHDLGFLGAAMISSQELNQLDAVLKAPVPHSPWFPSKVEWLKDIMMIYILN